MTDICFSSITLSDLGQVPISGYEYKRNIQVREKTHAYVTVSPSTG